MALESDGRSLWVGTYKAGVTRLDWNEGAKLADVTTHQLGDGWVNPGGLSYVDGTLYVSTMDGLFSGDGKAATWASKRTAAPGKDTTAVAKVGDRLWVSSRRGLVTL